jgi:hypothetical protein
MLVLRVSTDWPSRKHRRRLITQEEHGADGCLINTKSKKKKAAERMLVGNEKKKMDQPAKTSKSMLTRTNRFS